MPRVFVVNEPMHYDYVNKTKVHKYNLEDANRYGEVTHILPPGNRVAYWAIDDVSKRIDDAFKDITADDYIVLIGNPLCLFIAGAIACDRTDGRINVLLWNKSDQCYSSVPINAFVEE